MSTQQQALSMTDLAIEQLHRSRNFLTALLDTLADDQLHVRVGEGNHALWIMGHLAFADDLFISAFLNEPSCLTPEHEELFTSGTTPSDDPADYPDREELQKRMTTARNRFIDWAQTLEGETLWEASPEAVAPIASNAITAVHTLSQHDFFHAGQIATIRTSLGMKPVFG
ncbi:DinB family protein [Gimesia algae]|uniref:DinB superfamily protein n=1 Tax=Gimesia algae TaxID=2527971 RepID=A0A517V9F6_9PLAN|nr:DinB family protein [Gimesia algae]QDT89640.1 DinB superfamily protein [Gimesia algae]